MRENEKVAHEKQAANSYCASKIPTSNTIPQPEESGDTIPISSYKTPGNATEPFDFRHNIKIFLELQ